MTIEWGYFFMGCAAGIAIQTLITYGIYWCEIRSNRIPSSTGGKQP